jgi:hypothetical protein
MAISSRYIPNPEGVAPASQWGLEDVVKERFGDRAESIEFKRSTVSWQFDSLEGTQEWFEQNAGPAVAAKKFMPPDVYERFIGEIQELIGEMNQADDGSVAIESEFLVVVARKR